MARWSRISALAGVVVMAASLAAQSVPARGQTPAPTTVVSQPVSTETPRELGETQQKLMELLRVTPTLAEVMSSDPSLLSDQAYVTKTNPELAAYLEQHPEIGRNPSFWLFSDLKSPQQEYYEVLQPKSGFVPPRDVKGDALERVMGDVAPVFVLVVLTLALVWIIRTMVENRRWTKVFTLQSEVHAKLIDRFATNQELLGYMETDAGKRFLEASPIVTEAETRRMPNLVSRVMATLQVGLVLMLLGAGLIAVKNVVGGDAGTTMLVLGVIALMPGIGLILSAGVLWVLGKRLNLVETANVTDMEMRGRE